MYSVLPRMSVIQPWVVGLSEAHIYPLTLWTGESWPLWLPGTEHRRGAVEFTFWFHLVYSPTLLTLAHLRSGHLFPDVKKLVPLVV